MQSFTYYIFVNCCDIIVLHRTIISPRFELVKEALEFWGVEGYSAFIVFQKPAEIGQPIRQSRINPQRKGQLLRVLPESWKVLEKMWLERDTGGFMIRQISFDSL